VYSRIQSNSVLFQEKSERKTSENWLTRFISKTAVKTGMTVMTYNDMKASILELE